VILPGIGAHVDGSGNVVIEVGGSRAAGAANAATAGAGKGV
jgi:hypothetical protein